METSQYFYDDNFVRYRLVKTNPGDSVINWLFVPGGPGLDSIYLLGLVDELEMPGNFWLIDLPGNGENNKGDDNFEAWSDCLLSLVQKFENPIYVGHSFGGMFALLLPKLESLLKGLIILNAAPSLSLEEPKKYREKHHMALLDESLSKFTEDPNSNAFKAALLSCAPYYFPDSNMEAGIKFLVKIPFNYRVSLWWLKKFHEINFSAEWVPKNIPVLIIGSSHDFMTPHSLFQNDGRFDRENIKMIEIENAGHFPWLENMVAIKFEFNDFFGFVKHLVCTPIINREGASEF